MTIAAGSAERWACNPSRKGFLIVFASAMLLTATRPESNPGLESCWPPLPGDVLQLAQRRLRQAREFIQSRLDRCSQVEA